MDIPALAREFRRFLLVGTLNFVFTYALYYACLFLGTGYAVAFSISYFSGMVFAWLVNSLYSFSTRPRLRRLVPYGVVATINYLIGLQLLRWLVESLGVAEVLAPILVIAVLVPLSFLGTRLTLIAGLGPPRGD